MTRTVVSTDDTRIATVSRNHGAEVVERPVEISGDLASSEAALLHVLEHLRAEENYEPEVVVFLQCTAPLTAPEDIDGTVTAMLEEDADTGLAVVPFHYFLWRSQADGDAAGINHDKNERKLRQQQEPQYLEAGAVYVMRTRGFIEHRHRFFGKTAMHVIPAERQHEVDDESDLNVVEALIRHAERDRRAELIPDPVQAVVMDFDGVLTDNRVLTDEDGKESVLASRGDGMGIELMKRAGVKLLVLSKERNGVVQARSDKLGVPCLQGIDDKPSALSEWLDENEISKARTVYVGNDINDVDCMQMVGCGVAVGDAHPVALSAARIVLHAHGGNGAIRELADLILSRTGEPDNASDC